MAKGDYVFGVNDSELARLEYQHRIFADHTTRLWKRAGYARGHTVVELGAGPGFVTADLKSWLGDAGRLHAVDVSETYMAFNRTMNSHGRGCPVEFHVTDIDEAAWSGLGIADGSVDHVFARWLFSFLRRPEEVVQRSWNALRPGGTVAVIDYFNFGTLKMCPEGPMFHKAYAAMLANWKTHTPTPDIAAVLPRMLSQTGFVIERIDPLMLIARPGQALWSWPRLFFETQLDGLVEAGLLTAGDRSAWFEEWDRLSADPATFFSIPGMVQIIARRPR
ncbi:MAG: methyltransferase domain-containing protein [Phycisphaerales bacterium]|nr:methyltransferase domain-containing protein [Phycisphaerales bacterium]